MENRGQRIENFFKEIRYKQHAIPECGWLRRRVLDKQTEPTDLQLRLDTIKLEAFAQSLREKIECDKRFENCLQELYNEMQNQNSLYSSLRDIQFHNEGMDFLYNPCSRLSQKLSSLSRLLKSVFAKYSLAHLKYDIREHRLIDNF